MASRLIRNQLPRNGLRVRAPCPPLIAVAKDRRLLPAVFFYAAGLMTAPLLARRRAPSRSPGIAPRREPAASVR